MAENLAAGAGNFIWYELMTTDADGAKAFYAAVVGWDIEAEPSGDSSMDYRMIRRGDGGFAGGVLTLTEEMKHGGARPSWFGYVHVADVDAAVEAFEEAGGKSLMPAIDMEGVGRMALVADPQGAPIYVMTPTPPGGDPGAKSDVFDYEKAQHIRWNELQTSDVEVAAALYTDLFGWRQEGSMPMDEMGDYLFLHQGAGMIGAAMTAQGTDKPHWLYYIGTDDIDWSAKAITQAGGKVMIDPVEIPGGEFSLVGVDPQGAAFGVVGPRKDKAR